MNIKNLRVTLDNKILASKKVLIVPHNQADFDALGSAIGISLVVNNLNKHPLIYINDNNYQIDYGVKSIIDEVSNNIEIVNSEIYNNIKDDNDLVIFTDVNKSYLVDIKDNNKDNTIIIDHHDIDKNTIESSYKYINPSVSSASEIVAKLLEVSKIKIPSNIANYLLAGIYLDTNKLTKGVTPGTMRVIAKLLECGASLTKVNDYFLEDFISDRKVQSLVNKACFMSYAIAVLVADNNEIYTNQELAKAADYVLKYRVDASFAIGKVDDNIVSINGRSKEKINISKIMNELGGGGTPYSGATKIETNDVEECANKLIKKLQPNYHL